MPLDCGGPTPEGVLGRLGRVYLFVLLVKVCGYDPRFYLLSCDLCLAIPKPTAQARQ